VIKYLLDRNRELQSRRADEGFDGFTLIELLIVIVVIAILAATVIFALSGVTTSSAKAACNSDAKSVEVAVEAWHNYPGQTAQWPSSISDLTSSSALGGPYLHAAPNNQKYTITTSNGVVTVTPTANASAAGPYDATGSANPCDSVS
jgi:prepilin-type N-terminal cleavage/methylation domain-containing protein